MLCKNCSHWTKDGDTFCPNCGKKIKGNHPSAVKYIVIIGIAVIIFLIIKMTGKPQKETAILQTVQETALKLYMDYKRMMIEGSLDEAEFGCMEQSLKEKGWLD